MPAWGDSASNPAMSKFMMIYKGDATDTANMTEEQAAEVMAKWGAWMQKDRHAGRSGW